MADGVFWWQQSGEILFNGEGFREFVPERTAAYVDQVGGWGALHCPLQIFWRTSLAGCAAS